MSPFGVLVLYQSELDAELAEHLDQGDERNGERERPKSSGSNSRARIERLTRPIARSAIRRRPSIQRLPAMLRPRLMTRSRGLGDWRDNLVYRPAIHIGRSTSSMRQNVGAKSMMDTVRSSVPGPIPGPAATNIPPGNGHPCGRSVYSPSSSPIFLRTEPDSGNRRIARPLDQKIGKVIPILSAIKLVGSEHAAHDALAGLEVDDVHQIARQLRAKRLELGRRVRSRPCGSRPARLTRIPPCA